MGRILLAVNRGTHTQWSSVLVVPGDIQINNYKNEGYNPVRSLSGSQSADEAALEDAAPIDAYGAPQESYGAPASEPVNSYGAPAPSYEEPAPAYEAPSYEAPAPAYEAPQDTYGSPAAEVLPSYNAPSYALSY